MSIDKERYVDCLYCGDGILEVTYYSQHLKICLARKEYNKMVDQVRRMYPCMVMGKTIELVEDKTPEFNPEI